MKFNFQNNTYTFPTSLSQITLGQRVDFNNMYGHEIYERTKQIEEKEPEDQELEKVEIYLDAAYKTFSFFSGIELEETKNIPAGQVLNVYENCMRVLLEQQEDINLERRILWKDEFWNLESPQLSYNSDITFNQFITSKQIVKAMNDIGKGYWDSLPKLCAIFLRRDGEEFCESWLEDNSERALMMNELPLDIALQVGFFLKSSMSLSMNISQSSQEDHQKDQT